MPQRTKKEHKCSHHTAEGSRWHNFHFSGKVIVCSVILGFMLILIGGILMAIGMDNDDEKKTDNYDDLQKKPPMVFVGPAIMGIGGFAVVVGVLMCLFETQVCRKRNPDANPLINGEGETTEIKDGTDPTAVPSTSRHHHEKRRTGALKKSKTKRPHSSNQNIQIQPATQSSHPVEGGHTNKNFLTASDTFLTPPNSFADDVPGLPGKLREKDNMNIVKGALMQSLTSSGKSWNASTEFQTPSASFIDDPMSLQFIDKKEEQIENHHKFLTPMNSDAGIIDEKQSQEFEDQNQPNNASTSQETNPETITSSEVSVTVHKTEDIEKGSSQPIAQTSSDMLMKKDSTTEQTKPVEENQTSKLDTKEAELPNESSPSPPSREGNEDDGNNNIQGVNEQVNKSMDENASANIKDESVVVNPEVSSVDISDSTINSDGTRSVDVPEIDSQLNSVVVDSTTDDVGNITPELDLTSNEVEAPLESVNTLT